METVGWHVIGEDNADAEDMKVLERGMQMQEVVFRFG